MISERQRQANRLNALKSTGPKTPEGKAIASRNSSKHNIYSEETVVYSCGETDEMYAAHRDSLVASLRPLDAVQLIIVNDIASCTFRMQRLRRMEAGHLDARGEYTYNATLTTDKDGTRVNPFYDGFPNGEIPADSRLLGDTAAQVTTCTKLLPEIWRQETRLRAAWQKNLKLLKELQSEPLPPPDPPAVEDLGLENAPHENEAESVENKQPEPAKSLRLIPPAQPAGNVQRLDQPAGARQLLQPSPLTGEETGKLSPESRIK